MVGGQFDDGVGEGGEAGGVEVGDLVGGSAAVGVVPGDDESVFLLDVQLGEADFGGRGAVGAEGVEGADEIFALDGAADAEMCAEVGAVGFDRP